MRISYDPEADAVCIHLMKGQHQCRVVRLTDDIALDFTDGEKLAGIGSGTDSTRTSPVP